MASSEPSAPISTGPVEGRVRFRRFAAMAVPAAAVTATLVILTAEGAIAAQFSISGIPFTVTADELHGEGFEQFGLLDNTADGSPNLTEQNGQQLVMVSAIRSASLTNLCQSISIGGTNLVIRAGRGSTPVEAKTLVVDSDQLSGDAAFTNISIGQDASTVDKVPGVTGPLGDFAQQADTVVIKHLRQNNWATTASAFTLPGLNMSFSDTGC